MRPGDIVARGEQREGARNASNRERRRMKRERTKKKRRPEGGKKQYWQKSRGCPRKAVTMLWKKGGSVSSAVKKQRGTDVGEE